MNLGSATGLRAKRGGNCFGTRYQETCRARRLLARLEEQFAAAPLGAPPAGPSRLGGK